jgi:propionate CoA-transferase
MTETPPRVQILTADEAAHRVASGSVMTVSGLVGSLVPETTLRAIRRRFDKAGEPRSLTVIFPVAVGDVFEARGLDHLAHPEMLSAVVGGSFVYGKDPETGEEPELTKLIFSEQVHAYNFPIGVLFAAIREVGAKRPGLFTRVGIGTFQDPRERGGRLTDSTPPRFVSVQRFADTEYLHFELPPVDFALLRGTTADEYGNVSMEREVVEGGVLVQAMAAHNSGGTVIVQVNQLARGESLNPRRVTIPGTLVDAVVVAPGEQQATRIAYDPYLSGELKAPEPPPPELKPVEEIILRKVCDRLQPGDLVILGFGMPSKLPALPDLPPVRFAVEHGAIGGLPAGGLQFGGARNAEAVIDTPSMFDLIDGGGCDVACLGFAEVAPDGSVNVSRLPGALPGSGGFTNITASTRRVIFCGSFTAGGLQVERAGSGVRVTQEGRFKKFVRTPSELTFRAGTSDNQDVSFVTDRCLIERRDSRLVITEVYAGVDVERDILAQSEYPLQIAPEARG